jgi:hypothetical protein
MPVANISKIPRPRTNQTLFIAIVYIETSVKQVQFCRVKWIYISIMLFAFPVFYATLYMNVHIPDLGV